MKNKEGKIVAVAGAIQKRAKKTPAEYEAELSALRTELENEKALGLKERQTRERDSMVQFGTWDSTKVLGKSVNVIKHVEDLMEDTREALSTWARAVDKLVVPEGEIILEHFPCNGLESLDLPPDDLRVWLSDCLGLDDNLIMRIWQLSRCLHAHGVVPAGCTEDEVRLARWWLLVVKDLAPLVRAARGFRDSLARTLPQLVG